MAFTTNDIKVQDIFNNKIFNIPRNQRKYVWQESNWEELLTDLQFVIESNNEHFLGSIVLTKEPNITTNIEKFSIIDGQQRIITCTIILCVLAQIFLEREMKNNFSPITRLLMKKDIIDDLNIYPILSEKDNKTLYSIILAISKQDLNNFKTKSEIIKGLISKEKNILGCFDFFYNQLNAFTKNDNEKLIKYYEALLKIRLVYIVATTEEDSYTIFEILNARGVELEDYELLKNFTMRYFMPKNNIDTVKEKWNKIENELKSNFKIFLKHYTVHKFDNDSKDDRPYKIIVKNVKENEKTSVNITNLLNDLERKANYYNRIINPGDSHNSEVEKIIFAFLKQRRQQQFRPLILGLMSAKEDLKISEELYLSSLKYLFVFFVSYNMIGEENSNKIQDVISKYSREFSDKCNEDTIKAFKQSIEKKLPEEETFITAFSSKGYSSGHHQIFTGSKNADRAKIILMLIEYLLSNKLDLEFDFTIEHVDLDSNPNAYKFGNLLPLEESLNQKCKNKSIKEKLKYYSQSAYYITKNFAKNYNESWDYNEQTTKTAILIYKFFKEKMSE